MVAAVLADGLPESYKIDPVKEALLPFSQLGGDFPGNKVSLATLHRWRMNGVRGVRLPTIVVGNRRYSSRQAIAWFVTRQNVSEQPTPTITVGQRQQQTDAANAILEAAGI
jgi:hypothetical protein